ncbi:MAG: VTT domain-containing protein [Gammaproteobacteria bacterium]|nr:MAG: VTT domain-containing protein [Gammaproteobacteria bacterium]
MNWKPIIRGLLVIVSLVALGYFIKSSPLGSMLDEKWIDAEVRGKGLAGEMLFVGVAALFTAFGFPRQVVSFMGGYAFGFVTGTTLSVLGTILGCIAAFYYARLLGRRLIASRFPGRVKKIDAFIHDNPFSMSLLIRLLPVGSNLITSMAAGVSSVRGLPFFLGSGLGYIPQNFIFALIGSGINLDEDPTLRIGIGVLLFIVIGMLSVHLYRRYRHGVSLDTEMDEASGQDNGDQHA